MSDLNNIKPLSKSNMVRPDNKKFTKRDDGKKKKDKKALQKEEVSEKGHVSEYI